MLPQSTPTLADIAARFVAHNEKLAAAGMKAPTTADKYKRVARIIVRELGDTPVDQISRITIQEYQATRRGQKVSAVTINHEVAVLRAILGYASDAGHLRDLPKFKFLPESRREQDMPDLGQVRAFVERLPDDHRHPLLFSMLTGASWYEVERLEWRDVDFKKGTVGIGQREGFTTKNVHRQRVLSMSKPVRQLLHEAGPGENDQPVFRSAKATRRYLDRHEAGFSPGLMRKMFASHAADMGVPEHHLQRLMGHSPGSTITRKHYVRSQQTALRDSMNQVGEALA